MSKEREMVLLRTSDLIEEDSYGVHGSEFYRCKLCGGESGAGLLNKGITHDDACPLVVPPDPAVVGGELPAWLLVLIGEYGFAASAMTDVDRLRHWQVLIAGIKRYAAAPSPPADAATPPADKRDGDAQDADCYRWLRDVAKPAEVAKWVDRRRTALAADRVATTAMLTNPHTGQPRDYRDVESDPDGILCVPPGPLLAAKAAAPAPGEAVAWLSKDQAQLALFEAIRAIKLGKPTDDKLILQNLREAGFWIGRYTAPPAPHGDALTAQERHVIEALLDLAYKAWCLADDSEDMGDSHNVEAADFDALSNALDVLQALPDDQPGYTMGEAAKARWALRRLIGTDAAIAVQAKGGA